MKITREYQKQSRKTIDKRVQQIKSLDPLFEVPSGWLRAVRESLGLSAKNLEARMEASSGTVIRAEQRERDGVIALRSLNSLAQGMDCKLVYALIPLGTHESLEAVIESRAKQLANKMIRDVSNTMKLEAQATDASALEKERDELVRTLVSKLDARIWENDE